MSSTLIQEQLSAKENNAGQIAILVAANSALLPQVLDGLNSPTATTKFKSAKILKILGDNNPELLYPHFDSFVQLLDSENNILKWNAIDILAVLSTVDSDHNFERIFDKFYGLLNEGTLITCAHVVENSGKIAKARPEWKDKITFELLKVEQVPLPTEECRNIAKGKAIEALGEYFDLMQDKDDIVSFVRKQLGNTRNSTKKRAQAFLKKNKLSEK